jgi:hypothetical protein
LLSALPMAARYASCPNPLRQYRRWLCGVRAEAFDVREGGH